MKGDQIKKVKYEFNKNGNNLEDIFINMILNNLKLENLYIKPVQNRYEKQQKRRE